MNFYNIFVLILLFQIVSCEENKTCDFKTQPSAVKSVEQMAKPSKGLFQKFGLDIDFEDMIGLNLTDQGININSNFSDSVSFGIIFAAFFLIFFIYFLFFGICNCCCCCHAKNSKKPGIALIIFHFIGIALLVVTAILLFLSSSNTLKAINNIKTFPNNINTEIDGIFDKLNQTLTNTFDTINNNIDTFIITLTNFTNWLDSSNKLNNDSAQEIIPNVVKYNDTFGDEKKEYMKQYKKLYNDLTNQDTLFEEIISMNQSRQIAIDAIIEISQTLIDASDNISETSTNINKTIGSIIDDVKNNITDFQNDDLVKNINEIQEKLNGSFIDFGSIEDICDSIYSPAKIVFYIIAAFVLLVAILYSSIFFCHNCFSRCCACSFPIFGILMNLIIILPGCIFAILFVLFNNLCPELESTINGIINSSEDDDNDYYRTLLYNNIFFNRKANAFSLSPLRDSDSGSSDLIKNTTELLLCQANTPILDLINIDGFDPNQIIEEFSKEFNVDEELSFDIPAQGDLKDFAKDFDVDVNITSNHILLNHNETLEKALALYKDTAEKMKQIISENEPSLKDIRDKMRGVIEFGTSIVPKAEELQNETKQIVNTTISDANITLNAGLDSITCMPFRCIYSPFKNVLCIDLLVGLAFWILATVFLIITIAILSITVCRRRRSMAKPKIQNNTETDSDTSVDEFN